MIEGSSSNPDPYLWLWIWIQEAQKHTDPTDPDPDPKHWLKVSRLPILIYGHNLSFFYQAYPRAEQEEADCNRKASSRMLYLNLVVNTIKRLRNEAAEAAKAGVKVPPQDRQKNLLTTHMQVSFIFDGDKWPCHKHSVKLSLTPLKLSVGQLSIPPTCG